MSAALENEENVVTIHDFSLRVFGSIPVITFAFAMHLQMFPLWVELRQPTSLRMHLAVGVAFMICTVVYLIVGIFGYLTFFHLTSSNSF